MPRARAPRQAPRAEVGVQRRDRRASGNRRQAVAQPRSDQPTARETRGAPDDLESGALRVGERVDHTSMRVRTWSNRKYRTAAPMTNAASRGHEADPRGGDVQDAAGRRRRTAGRHPGRAGRSRAERDRPHRDHRGEVRQRRQPDRPDARRFVDQERRFRTGTRRGRRQDHLQQLGRLAADYGPIDSVSRAPLTS